MCGTSVKRHRVEHGVEKSYFNLGHPGLSLAQVEKLQCEKAFSGKSASNKVEVKLNCLVSVLKWESVPSNASALLTAVEVTLHGIAWGILEALCISSIGPRLCDGRSHMLRSSVDVKEHKAICWKQAKRLFLPTTHGLSVNTN